MTTPKVFAWLLATAGWLWSGVALAGATAEPAASQASADRSALAEKVDSLLAQELYLKNPKSALAPLVSDEVFLRRAALDVIGIRPSQAQMALFLLDPSVDRRQKLVDRLLADPRFGRNWGRYWRDVVMYRRVEDRALISAAALTTFLTDALNDGQGWDQIAETMIEAKGNVMESGPTGLIMAQTANADDVAAEVSRIFLGIQIQCAQCHDHPTDRWKREQFHQFAAFFPRMQLRPIQYQGMMRGFEVASVQFEPRFRGPMPGRGSLEHYMPDLKNPSAKGQLMTPVFFATGRKLPTGSSDDERRTSIAEWITAREDGWFAKAFVNRVWAELVGEGFYEPVDDMGPGKACSAPATLAYLAEQFAARSYDVRWLYRTIMATKLYARESRPRRTANEMPFAANCAQRLRGDQLFDMLTLSLGVEVPGYFGGGPYAAISSPRAQFNTVFGYDPSQRRDEVSGSISQVLSMMNSRLVSRGLDGHSTDTTLGRLLVQFKDDDTLIAELFSRCLARDPNGQELTVCREHVKHAGSRAEGFEDVLWGLVNRTEFIYRN
jgi:hypothetical protein